MGKTYGKIFLLNVLCFGALVLHGSEDSGSAAELRDFSLPGFSRKSGKLEYILYGERAFNLGGTVTLKNPTVDMIRRDVRDINQIKSLAGVRPYALMTPYKEVEKFWKDKKHSEALIFSQKAVYDKNLKILRGDDKVYFRTPELSVDGIGFDADHERKFVHIRQKVRIVLYQSARKKGPGITSDKK